MYNRELVVEIINQILTSVSRIERRMKTIRSATDFLRSERNLEKLDSICMQLIALGESIKNLDKVTKKTLLKNYTEFGWKKVYPVKFVWDFL